MQKNEIKFRVAKISDLEQIVGLLSDDDLGREREKKSSIVSSEYIQAFNEIENDQNNEVIVGESGDAILAVLQITYIPNLTLQGTKRAQIEGVRVSSALRGQGVGQLLFEFAFQRAKANGCKLVQLTTNKSRQDAVRFYEKIGFKCTHEGMKLSL